MKTGFRVEMMLPWSPEFYGSSLCLYDLLLQIIIIAFKNKLRKESGFAVGAAAAKNGEINAH